MCTAVVQLFTTEAPAQSAWIRRVNGIACFVRDSSKRSYFIRVYCLLRHELVWEEEMYDTILINKPREFLISFEGKVWNIFQLNCYYLILMCHSAFEFCDYDDASRGWSHWTLNIHLFPFQDCMVALSFASTAETNAFYKTAITTVSNRTKRRHGMNDRLL